MKTPSALVQQHEPSLARPPLGPRLLYNPVLRAQSEHAMVELLIPISQFLNRAIAASASSDYLAFITIIARTADGEFLQNELLRHWESFDDLTADQILILSPKSARDDYDAFVRHWREPAGLVNHTLKFGNPPTRDWDGKFWNSSPVSTSKEPGFYDALGGTYSPRRPPDEADKKAAMTASASETARYFGIPERWLPCVVALSLSDQQVLIISVDEWFSLYALIRTALIDYEPVVRTREKHKKRADELLLAVRRKEEEIAKARSPLNAAKNHLAHVAASWEEQIEAASRMLATISETSPPCRAFADFLVEWLHDRVETPPDFDAQWQSWLAPIAAGAIDEIPGHLVLRVKARLPRTIQRKQNGYLAETSSTVAATRQAEELCQRTVAQCHIEIEQFKLERSQLLSDVAELKTANPISRSLLATAAREHYHATNAKIGLPSLLNGWMAYHVVKAKAPDRTFSVQADKYDVALSFAGEDRGLARDIANQLRLKGITVFYDEFEKYRLWGVNLVDYLTSVYFQNARFCMMLISEPYVRKMWTGLERQAMQAGALTAKVEAILPVRIDDSEVPGLLPTVGYLDYRHDGIEAIVSATVKRVSSFRSQEHRPPER
jgi:hypothetical protein